MRFRPLLTGLVGTLMAATAACGAQTSFPFLYSLYPCGIQRGTTAEITLAGLHDYHSAYKVLIEGKGVTGEVVTPNGGWPTLRWSARAGKSRCRRPSRTSGRQTRSSARQTSKNSPACALTKTGFVHETKR